MALIVHAMETVNTVNTFGLDHFNHIKLKRELLADSNLTHFRIKRDLFLVIEELAKPFQDHFSIFVFSFARLLDYQ
jgi:dynactin complex subunit